jgi:hypothetical protein
MKKPIIAIIATLSVTGVALLGALLYPVLHPPALAFNGARLFEAVRQYRVDLLARDGTLPATVSLRELTNQGYLHAREVAAFAGLETTIALLADESRPHEVLMSARFPDGAELVALADGSVQTVRR